jgi:tryptophan synthase alpha chain
MLRLMTHLVANYPNPLLFCDALKAMLKSNVEFLEIQLPFTNPVADGQVIYEANQVAREYGQSLLEILAVCHQIKQGYPNNKTKLILVAYVTTIFCVDLNQLVVLLRDKGFSGLIIPDLPFGRSPEQLKLSQLCNQYHLQLIPVIARNTSESRLIEIGRWLEEGQLIYAMARTGQTGEVTDLSSSAMKSYLNGLKSCLGCYQTAIGFGIKNKHQVAELNSQGFIAVIGTEVVRKIKAASASQSSVYDAVYQFVEGLS